MPTVLLGATESRIITLPLTLLKISEDGQFLCNFARGLSLSPLTLIPGSIIHSKESCECPPVQIDANGKSVLWNHSHSLIVTSLL